MPPFIPEFLKSTLSLLGFVGLGMAGGVDGVEMTDRGMLVESAVMPSFALGDIAYHDGRQRVRDHEYGHLVHEDEIGPLYLPLAGLSSAFGNWRGLRGEWTQGDYLDMYTERKADEYGGVKR